MGIVSPYHFVRDATVTFGRTNDGVIRSSNLGSPIRSKELNAAIPPAAQKGQMCSTGYVCFEFVSAPYDSHALRRKD